MKASFFLIFFSLFPLSCGQSPKEKVELAINKANFYLTRSQCNKAVNALDDVDYQSKNVDYILAHSSALACRDGYSTTTLFFKDIPNMATGMNSILASLATFSTSEMIGEDDIRFNSIKESLNRILLAGGITQSSHANRLAVKEFSEADVERLNVLALYLVLVQMGRFSLYYGNANNEDGAKGKGDQGNECYLTYSDPAADILINLARTDCKDSSDNGHRELDASRNMRCYGIILFNNFLDLLKSLIFAGKKNVKKLIEISDNVTDLCEIASKTYDFGKTCSTKTFKKCVEDTVNHSDAHIERFYAAIYENMHK